MLYKEKIYDAIRLYLENIKTECIFLKLPDGICRIEVDHVLAVKTLCRGKVKVYTTDGLLLEALGSLGQLQKQLPENFICINKSCIINFHAVQHYNPKLSSQEISIVCNGVTYPFTVSRRMKKDFLAWFYPDNSDNDEL